MRLSPIIKDKKVTYSNSSLKLCKERKGVFTIANASVYSNASQYSGAIRACKKFASTSTITKNLTILQTKRLSNPSSA